MGRMIMKLTQRVLGHSLLRSLIRSHRSPNSLAHSATLIPSLAHFGAHGIEIFVYKLRRVDLMSFQPTARRLLSPPPPLPATHHLPNLFIFLKKQLLFTWKLSPPQYDRSRSWTFYVAIIVEQQQQQQQQHQQQKQQQQRRRRQQQQQNLRATTLKVCLIFMIERRWEKELVNLIRSRSQAHL